MHKTKWKLTIREWDGQNIVKERGIYYLKLKDVWNDLGFKLKKERCGYAGMVGNTEYTVVKMPI